MSAPWPLYAGAVIEMILDGEHLVLTPMAPRGEDPGDEGDDTPPAGLGPHRPVWVLTAGDPYPEELDTAENAARNARLVAELEAAGVSCDPALGRSPDGSTSERSVAVRGSDRATVLTAASRYEQLAVYEIDDRIRCIEVATGAIMTSRAYRLERAPAGSGRLVGPTGWQG
jgi:hypothetical protein